MRHAPSALCQMQNLLPVLEHTYMGWAGCCVRPQGPSLAADDLPLLTALAMAHAPPVEPAGLADVMHTSLSITTESPVDGVPPLRSSRRTSCGSALGAWTQFPTWQARARTHCTFVN